MTLVRLITFCKTEALYPKMGFLSLAFVQPYKLSVFHAE